MRKWIVSVVAVVLGIAPSMALAWNSTGHATVALIAYRELSDAQRKQIAQILKSHPHYQQLLLANKPADVDEGEWAFLRAASWPDMVRPARQGDRYKSPAITHYHRGPWHYIDIPFVVGDFKMPATHPSTRPEENAVTALKANLAIFASAESKPEDRAVALAWIEHLVGDIHQPLHAVSLYSEKFPNGDMGGNAQMVRTSSGVMRLHGFWDELLGTSDDYRAIVFLADEITRVANEQTTTLMHQTTSIDSWAQESHDYAVAITYLNGELRSTPSSDWDQKKVTAEQVPALPVAYEANAQALARQRILLAGHRLAQQLQAALKD